MVMRLLSCLLLILAMPAFAASQLQASVDKNPVLAGEFFDLTISIDDSVNNSPPDTSVLLKDFVVGPTRMSSRTNIVNGEISKQTNWTVRLMTREEGDYTIPSFTVAGLSSEPIQLKVAKRSQDSAKNKDAFITTELQPESLFVQEAGVYTVKLYLARELLDGSLSTPEMADAQLSQIGKQSESYELIDGKRYLVISRDYLVQPQKSGDYTIKAPLFNGRVRENYRQQDISAMGEDLNVTIKPIAENYQGSWLPSELVNLDEQWQPESNTVEVGTPITRTITLTALGVTKEQLPDIKLADIQGIRSYPDEKEVNHLVRDGRVISQQTASFALLPQTPGTYTLPEVKVPWFNTKINRISYATLPERTLTVVASSNPVAVPTIPPTSNTDDTPVTNSATPQQIQPATSQTNDNTLLVIIAVLGYLAWLLTLLMWFVASRKQGANKNSQKQIASATNTDLAKLKQLANKGEHQLFYSELNCYAQSVCNHSNAPLKDLQTKLNNREFDHALNQLRAKLYGNNGGDADLNKLMTILQQHEKTSQQTANDNLKSLYS